MSNTMDKPVAICTTCGRTSRRVESINQSCGNVSNNGKRCRGSFASMLGEHDWEQCPSCAGTGRVDGSQCSQCRGDGCLPTRSF